MATLTISYRVVIPCHPGTCIFLWKEKARARVFVRLEAVPALRCPPVLQSHLWTWSVGGALWLLMRTPWNTPILLPDDLIQLTAMCWMREFIQLAGRVMLPYSSGILTAVLPCLAYDDRKKSILHSGERKRAAPKGAIKLQDPGVGDGGSLRIHHTSTFPQASKQQEVELNVDRESQGSTRDVALMPPSPNLTWLLTDLERLSQVPRCQVFELTLPRIGWKKSC